MSTQNCTYCSKLNHENAIKSLGPFSAFWSDKPKDISEILIVYHRHGTKIAQGDLVALDHFLSLIRKMLRESSGGSLISGYTQSLLRPQDSKDHLRAYCHLNYILADTKKAS